LPASRLKISVYTEIFLRKFSLAVFWGPLAHKTPRLRKVRPLSFASLVSLRRSILRLRIRSLRQNPISYAAFRSSKRTRCGFWLRFAHTQPRMTDVFRFSSFPSLQSFSLFQEFLQLPSDLEISLNGVSRSSKRRCLVSNLCVASSVPTFPGARSFQFICTRSSAFIENKMLAWKSCLYRALIVGFKSRSST